jgi:hypothetical protein
MAIKLHTVGASETNLKHYLCVSGQNHLVISTPGLQNITGFRTASKVSNVEFPTLR